MSNMERIHVSQNESREFETLSEDANTLIYGNVSDPKIQSMSASCSSYQGGAVRNCKQI